MEEEDEASRDRRKKKETTDASKPEPRTSECARTSDPSDLGLVIRKDSGNGYATGTFNLKSQQIQSFCQS